MVVSKFDKKIRKLRSKEKKCISKMEYRRKEFVNAVKKFIPSWYSQHVEEVVKSYPENTKLIGLDGVKVIKSELNELIDEVQETVEEKLSSKELWSHFFLETQIKLEDFIYNVKRPRILDDVIQSLLSGAIPLLARHGYEKAAHELETIMRNPLRRDDRLNWSLPMDAVMESYFDLHKQLMGVNDKISKAEKDRSLAEAKALWERA